MSLNNLRKPYEEVLAGYYMFGSESYVAMGHEYQHKNFVAIHERTHLNLGTSTSMGLFQQFLAFLDNRKPYQRFPEFVRPMLSFSCDNSRDPHEAAATYEEFCAAQCSNYDGLSDMERDLLPEYKNWRDIFDNFLRDEMPLEARGTAAYHLARFALNTTILQDYREISFDKIMDFKKYMAISNNNPNERLRRILAAIDQYGKARFFGDYVEFRMDVSEVLENAYSDRTLESRRISFGIQKKIREIMVDAAGKLAFLEPIFADKSLFKSPVPHAKALVQAWETFLRNEGYVEALNFYFQDTDEGADVDILDENEVLVTRQSPHQNLYPLEGMEANLVKGESLARIWAWNYDEPFVLCERPYRVLNKGDFYVRLVPFGDLKEAYFEVTSS